MAKEQDKPQFSERISEFCKMIDGAREDYEWNKDEISRLDKLTQDYLHMLELDGLDYKGRAKVATQLTKCRQERRASKDTTQILEPLIVFLDSEKGKNMMNLMREILGKTRKVEENMKTRTYRYKVFEPPEDCSYWFAVILHRRFIRSGAKIMFSTDNFRFGTLINGKVYGIDGEITDNCQWVSWVEFADLETKDRITKQKILF